MNVVLSLNTLTVTSQPASSVIAGSAMGTVRVEARNALGLGVPNVPVTITIGTNPGGGSLSGTVPITTNASGVATFSDLSINKSGAGYTLVASSGGYASVASSSFTVTPATATQLVVTSPASVTGAASATTNIGPITVERRDPYGNPATAGSTTVTLAAASGGSGVFGATAGVAGPGLTTVTIAAGSSSTAFYYGDTKSGSRPFTATGLGSPLTVPVDITAAAASKLVFDAIPAEIPKNVAFSATVRIEDAFSNQTPSTASITLTTTGAACTVTNIPTVTTVAGAATFSGLLVNGKRTGCQLTANSGVLPPGTVTFNTY